MSSKSTFGRLVALSLLSITLCACFRPPYNDFKPYRRTPITATPSAAVGTAAVAAAGGPILLGTALGGVAGAAIGYYRDSKPALINELQKLDIQYVEYGDMVTLLVPTDRYYMLESARLNQLCYPGLNTMIKLIKTFKRCCPIYVAGFTDNVGSARRKQKMSQAQAETMVGFLWANDIQAQRLVAEGYGDKNPIGDNSIIRGSAYNRRVEIQIQKTCDSVPYQAPRYVGVMK